MKGTIYGLPGMCNPKHPLIYTSLCKPRIIRPQPETKRLGLYPPEEITLTRAVRVSLAAVATFALAIPFCTTQAHAAEDAQKPLTVQAIFGHGPLIGTQPEGLTWSPDSKHLTYMDGGELMELNPATGKGHVLVSRAKLVAISGTEGSEIDRDHRSRYKMASYLWSPDETHLLFDANGRLWNYDLHNGTGVQIGFTGAASGDDPKFSPDGQSVSYIRDHGLSVVRFKDAGMPPTVVAPAPNKLTLNGEVDWVYEEELEVRSNYFWSPDSKGLAYLQMDESGVPEYPITDWTPTHATVEEQRYPQPGDANPDVRVGVVSAGGGKTQWVKLPIHAGQDYIPRFGWVDKKTLWIETLTRDHKHRSLYFADLASGKARPVLEISDEKFVDDNYEVSVGLGFIVLTSWTDGHSHLYLYSYDQGNPTAAAAKLERQLTKGDFEVGNKPSVDAAAKVIRYVSNEGDPLEQQLWQVDFAGEKKQLTREAGFHDANFAPTGGAFVDKASTRMDPPKLSLCQDDGQCRVFWTTKALEPYRLSAPERIEVKAKDGTALYATVLLPAGMTSAATVPLIVNPYGGPGPQTVANRWGTGCSSTSCWRSMALL
jgi:dipeptidyl-peptidase 4